MKLAAMIMGATALLAACGGGTPVTPDANATPTPTPTPGPISAECADDLRPVLDALEQMDARLDVGLNRSQYGDRMGDVSVAYNRLDATTLVGKGAGCIATAVLLEEAFNEYIQANTAWGDCIASSSCSMDSVQPKLQRHWSTASGKLTSARRTFP